MFYIDFKATVFTLVSANLNRKAMVNIFINCIEKIAQSNQAPFIAKVYNNQPVKIWKNNKSLLKLIK